MTKFSIGEYWNLIKKQQLLDNVNEMLLNVNEKDFSRLAWYNRTLSGQIYYNSRYQYWVLLQEYLTKFITVDQFITKIFELEYDNDKIFNNFKWDLKQLIFFVFNHKLNELNQSNLENLQEFGGLIREILEECTYSDFTSEDEFEQSMRTFISEFQDFL